MSVPQAENNLTTLPQHSFTADVPLVQSDNVSPDLGNSVQPDFNIQKVPLRRGSRSESLPNDVIRPIKRTSSCPPGRALSAAAGPWSLKWVNRFQNIAKVDSGSSEARSQHSVGSLRFRKKKGNGYIQHCARNLKRIARLSEKDHKEVLRALRKKQISRKRCSETSKNKVNSVENPSLSDSQASVNNDWSNWLLLHGGEKVKNDDVRGIGSTLGLKFKGDKNNKFDVLSGVGRKNPEEGGKEG